MYGIKYPLPNINVLYHIVATLLHMAHVVPILSAEPGHFGHRHFSCDILVMNILAIDIVIWDILAVCMKFCKYDK